MHEPTKQNRRALSADVRWFWAILWGAASIFLIWQLIYAKRGYGDPEHRWPFAGFHYQEDFYVFTKRFHFVHHLNFFELSPAHGPLFGYPAPTGAVYKFFYTLPYPQFRWFLGITLAGLCLLLWWGVTALKERGVARGKAWLLLGSSVLLSYPFWFVYLGGNMEIIVFLLVAFGLVAFLRGHDYPAAVLFGLATSMKLFPLTFFGLFLARGRVRPVLVGSLTFAVSLVMSLLYLCPSLPVSWRGNLANLKRFQDTYFTTGSALSWDHSLFGSIRAVLAVVAHQHATSGRLLQLYTVSVAIVGLALFVLVIRKLPLLNQICALTIASIWLPPTSIDYTLLHLYVPTVLLMLLSVEAWRARAKVPGLTPALVCCALLLAPEGEFIALGHSLGGIVKSFVFFYFFVLVLRVPMVLDAVESAGKEKRAPQDALLQTS